VPSYEYRLAYSANANGYANKSLPSLPRRAATMSSTLSVRDVCERYGVSEHTVLGWLRSGELKGFSVGRRLDARKPRWRITQGALEAFELSRTPTPPPPRGKRRKRPGEVIEFYK
jgi:excisionase family DNA binding protein